ncbi:MAG: glutamate--tRNA ligase [Leptospiraceae bacterium]|nr:glutamate--tRNA ligase [Leptospiraceae bacterium]MCK6380364.1 glutamate--tRNA ligase [Leptospiraceae bacterium]NUM41299.1 glutamate--tRNA ligase [Leptospiraceae bacterium]
MSKEVRTRFAPSPSGFLHVGGARTALFNYLYAKSNGGKFILRIEDTDQDRSTQTSFDSIVESMKWLGLKWDEGPEVGGPYGPYKQSERISIYKKYTEKLLTENKAYRCFCTTEELEAKKKHSEAMGVPNIYDGLCSGMTESEIQTKLDNEVPYSIRFRTIAKTLIVGDLIQGKVKFDTKLIGDFIIVKSDDFPSYNYAVVIDDYLMKISHVIRGVGHLSNTPRQVLIHEALGMDIPEYAHVSEIVGSDGKKLSKRAGATSILAFRDLGYLPDCFVNYMSLLGWTSEDGQEYIEREKLEKIFDVNRCSKSPSMFDVFKKSDDKDQKDFNSLATSELAEYLNPKSKLNWLSNKFIRDSKIKFISEMVLPYIQSDNTIPNEIKNANNETLKSILESIRVYLDRLSDAPPYISEFFNNSISTKDEETKKMILEGNGVKVIKEFYLLLKKNKPTTVEDYKELMAETGKISGEKGKLLFMPIRGCTTGKLQGLELPVLFSLLGVDKILQRIESICKELSIQL